ncbi:uncharacterized protein B0H18DRAFT_1120728 [Fomitopsis serialis]|uniref:uncharacterized protein n=1 Tax=Fomitopsis serialis TaxID=139415 RepID=UPI002007C7C4|nr:uncharacterized protein B0H18DRAFT_1120728 [Neoantrodia serialis]KAH9922732.1 hypothetical protein B0H18DRAFT_1120728 [Neoantrodia serialis]
MLHPWLLCPRPVRHWLGVPARQGCHHLAAAFVLLRAHLQCCRIKKLRMREPKPLLPKTFQAPSPTILPSHLLRPPPADLPHPFPPPSFGKCSACTRPATASLEDSVYVVSKGCAILASPPLSQLDPLICKDANVRYPSWWFDAALQRRRGKDCGARSKASGYSARARTAPTFLRRGQA